MRQLPEREITRRDSANEISKDSGFSIVARIRATVRQFKIDLRAPLPGAEELSFLGKARARFVHLFKRYGWKLLLGLFLYYLIRDTILYIVLPYLVARQVLG